MRDEIARAQFGAAASPEFPDSSEKLRMNERSAANHLSLIRSILIDSGR